ncbi:MAG: hypothetical protein COT89_03165 [Candidatus Colwellbacteria bacterium CG10_big_fil_rev_8_21_14_0_10_42_22]|uniref:Uncharacterized protein n=1 Tax=Candidatus Colwellbacteria bacterium CG10_big_fil_rev_8_21_14_0_10_42_22 TaxID=1974540 RepID=A0A2H0VHC9_9BACT|nr:MAG: hypothetical protein COT89_03165 [Candidatus Colwellbacteria bacterium CG10_big_fil_rev_8_21_14_0_10_42_22]
MLNSNEEKLPMGKKFRKISLNVDPDVYKELQARGDIRNVSDYIRKRMDPKWGNFNLSEGERLFVVDQDGNPLREIVFLYL